MFKIDDCFKSSDIFNEILRKRFEENFNPEGGSRLWMIPGHIVFTTDNSKIHTCDARPYDFSTSPNEAETDELLATSSSVLDIVFDTENTSTRMFVVLTNGDVQIFEYRTLLFEWARIGYFNVNIVSPNSNNNHVFVTQTMISQHQNMIYWSQKIGSSDISFDLHKREIPLNGVREITQSAIGVPQKLLKNCPVFDLVEIRDNICIVPHLPNSINLYIIISARLHIWLFHIDGKLLWRGIIGDSPVDFISLCTKSMGLWHQTGSMKVCKLLDNVKNYAYILNNDSLISIAPNGELRNKTCLGIVVEDMQDCFIMQNTIYLFKDSYKFLQIHSVDSGQLLQSFDLTEHSPISGIWYNASSIPSIGFYSDHRLYKLNYKSLKSLLISNSPCNLKSLNLLKQENFHVFSLLRDVVHHRFESCDIPPLKSMPKVLQSEALLLAVKHSCRENGFKSKDFPVKKSNFGLPENNNEFPQTKLNKMLNPLVDCFQKLEKCRNAQ
ncbi:uncharacterized protein CEXT_73051 [Caerostris extrusa]|uniref:Uncharacterized protein n=1 Tax=Caerostris extrusa TaxID=172846 RepID=A0AAV4NGG4_CAEEX|nr:uncharacterized protein CEXT_73051 [Caerostris extrusa]